MSDTQTVMCINSGSSSLKFHLYEMGPGGADDGGAGGAAAAAAAPGTEPVAQLLARGAVEGVGQGQGRLWFVDREGTPFAERDLHDVGHEQAIGQALAALSAKDLPSVEAVGHRVVHGGPNHVAPELVTDELVKDLRAHTAWAPLHMPATLLVMEALRRRRPDTPQVACFDTAFHARMPEIARRLPLPRHFFDEGVYKYGFHGLSYEYVIGVLGGRLFESKHFCHEHAGQIQVCTRSVDCSVRSLWHALQSVVDEVLSKTTLQDLLRTEGEMNSWVKGKPGNSQLTLIQ